MRTAKLFQKAFTQGRRHFHNHSLRAGLWVNKSRFQKHSREALDKFLMLLNILSLDRSSAREAAEIRVELEAKGRPIGPYDLLIAGIARSRNLIVVTNNVKDFGRVKGLSHENWAV